MNDPLCAVFYGVRQGKAISLTVYSFVISLLENDLVVWVSDPQLGSGLRYDVE